MLAVTFAAVRPATAANYFLTGTYSGGGSCGTDVFLLPVVIQWNFPPPNTIVTQSGTFSVNNGPALPFTTNTYDTGSSAGTASAGGIVSPGANTGGTNTYTYVEIDYDSVAG